MINLLKQKNSILCRLPGQKQWGLFSKPCNVLKAHSKTDIPCLLQELEESLAKKLYAAGFISYEASPVFDNAIITKQLHSFPYIWFALFDTPPQKLNPEDLEQAPAITQPSFSFKPELNQQDYTEAVEKIKKYIYEGDIYQANFTFRCNGPKLEDPASFFLSILSNHPVPYSAYVNMGETKILSISPELFCENHNSNLFSLPMKGTAARNKTYEADRKVASKLSKDIKNRAENVMIVDMVRNDFAHICQPNSIHVNPLFHVDTYQTVHQMVSGVHGKLDESNSLLNILQALFPAASITGAPKVRATEIINELEISPRKVYTGAIGCIYPNKDFCFNVPIRTLLCTSDKTELGIGSGIVADSDPYSEWQECITKKQFSYSNHPKFEILDTFLWTRQKGFSYPEAHLARAKQSQLYFGRPWQDTHIKTCIDKLEFNPEIQYARVRLLINSKGNATTEIHPLPDTGWPAKNGLKVKVSNLQTNSNNTFLYHKTTNRAFYNEQFKLALSEGFDEVIFTNEKGEITEGSISNIFLLQDKQWYTPPVSCGLLAGIQRQQQFATLNAKEKILHLQDLQHTEKIILCNSVRGCAIIKELQLTPNKKLAF